jgi:hypothetical protein
MREELAYNIKKLVGRALQGYVTHDALNAAMPPDEYTTEEIKEMLGVLSSKGITIVDTEAEGAISKKGVTHGEVIRCCSFCEKGTDKVKRLVAGNKGYICDECVSLCMLILAQQDRAWFDQQVEAARAFRFEDLIDAPNQPPVPQFKIFGTDVAQPGRALRSGRRGRRLESHRDCQCRPRPYRGSAVGPWRLGLLSGRDRDQPTRMRIFPVRK